MAVETLIRKPSRETASAPAMILGRVLDYCPKAPSIVDYALDLKHNFPAKTVARVIEYATANARESKIRIEFANGGRATFRADKVTYRSR